MFQQSAAELEKLGAEITTREIRQQPELWMEALDLFKEQEAKIKNFLDKVLAETDQKIRVIFTGAGTSQYVGDTIVPYLSDKGSSQFVFESIATTSIVATPADYLAADDVTVLVSFARSGNSPESVATVEIANQVVKNLFHITITCAKDGSLAKNAAGDERNLLLLQPERSNDDGFAMTGSFSCMALTALLVFDQTPLTAKEKFVADMITLGKEVIAREAQIQGLIDKDFDRIVYLGSGSLAGLTRESQLKILELTAGKIATVFDSSMGFRHGPKSFVNEETLVFVYQSNDEYTRQYDQDILHEVAGDEIARATVAISQSAQGSFTDDSFIFESQTDLLPEGYLALPFQMVAQTVSLLASVKVGNTPDTPSPSGTVNRVVKGVTIHPYQ
ncbi:SIS domain-containing protein [Enterococcus sp. LJL120]